MELKNHLYSVVVICLCLATGYGLNAIISNFPASLFGLLLLTISLQIKLVDAEKITSTVNWIIANMGVCFVPAGVGIMEHFGLLANYGIYLLIITIFTTLLLITVVAWLKQKNSNNTTTNKALIDEKGAA